MFVIRKIFQESTLVVFFIITTGLFFVAQAASPWYSYEPKVSEISGVLQKGVVYGPPGYGEDPENDRKITYYVLKLSKPINVKGNPKSDLNCGDLVNVKEIQLVIDDFKQINTLLKQRVRVKGTLFRAHTGYHYKDLLMNVQEIAKLPYRVDR